MFLCVKGKELPLSQDTLNPPTYEVKINVLFGFCFDDESLFGMSQAIQKSMKLTEPSTLTLRGENWGRGAWCVYMTHQMLPLYIL